MLESACMCILKLLPSTTVPCTVQVSDRYTKNTTISFTICSGGGSPSLLFVAVSPVPQAGVRLFIVLSYRYRLSFYRYRIIETFSMRYCRFFIERYYRKFRYDIQP